MKTLPDEDIEKYKSYFEKHGMTVSHSVVEEMLLAMAKDGVENPDYPRFYALGNEEEQKIFERIESVSEGDIWKGDMKIQDTYYRVACNLIN